jgi:DNA repair protein RadC
MLPADIHTTTRLHKAGEILNIPLLDHIIFTAQGSYFFSFKDNKTQSILQTHE